MAYTLLDARFDTRRHLKDDTENVWSNIDINAFVNEAILIIKNTVPLYFTTLLEVSSDTDTITIDNVYKKLISLFASARCFEQDEQNYRAVKNMNEFESRREEMKYEILDSDAYADILAQAQEDGDYTQDYVIDVYFDSTSDDDEVPPLVP